MPTAEDELPRRGRARAWAAGRDGRKVLDEICDAAPGHLRPGGVLLVVHSSLNDEDATLERLDRAGFVEARVTERHLGPLGPLMAAQQHLGHLPSHLDDEAVVILRAVAGD